jgi:very-short-patch-repair endonuclease/predicted transcriptional regulator of viral defense system
LDVDIKTAVDAVSAVAERQAGAFTAEQVSAAGVSRQVQRRLVTEGLWVPRRRGLFVVAGSPAHWLQQLWLAYLSAGPEAVICGRAAAALHHLRGYRPGPVAVMVLLGDSHRSSFGRVRRTRYLPPHHITWINGLPVTTIARTIFDLAGDPGNPIMFRREDLIAVHERQLRRLIRDAVVRRGLSMSALVRVTIALGRRGRAGSAVMRSLIKQLGKDYKPTDSELEEAFLDLVRAEGFESPNVQVHLRDREGWIGRVDFTYRSRTLVVEVDGPDHDDDLQRAADRERDDRLRRAGWTVIRIHWTQLIFDPDSVVADLLRILRPAA